MKHKMLLMILVGIAVAWFFHRQATPPVQPQSASNFTTLSVIQTGLRSLEGGSDAARRAKSGHEAMDVFLETWSPIGRTPRELKGLFGEPKEERGDRLLYAFDNGNYSWLYQFVVRDGKVTELLRPLSE